MIGIFMLPVSAGLKIIEKKAIITFGTSTANAQPAGDPPKPEYTTSSEFTANPEDISIGCNLWPGTWFTNCIALTIYYIIWTPVSILTSYAAQILDFFVYYSTNSNSYTASFIQKGWAAVRDISNIFFIIALLYVAIKTVLGLNVSNNKKLVGYVIIVALLMNFSLFTTQVVIDGSNILAKIFYNNIKPIGKNGEVVEPGGQKSISVSLAEKAMDPKVILATIPNGIANNVGVFVFVTLFSIVVLGFMIYVFLSVALLFVSRVVSLWISMIFSPIAFASYALPFKIPEMGHDEWWNDLLKNAFLAPIFIFFLYIILMFTKALPGVGTDMQIANGWLDTLIKGSIPFAIIIVLLLQAKKLATTYAGKIGAMVIKGAKMIGGFALGAAAGATAFVGGAAIGGTAAKLLGSGMGQKLIGAAEKKGMRGFFARQGLKTLNYGTKASFDVRKTGLGKGLGNVSGMNFQSSKLVGLGSKEGGFKGMQDRKATKIKKEAEMYKTTMSDKEVMEWSLKEIAKYLAEKEEAMKNGMTEQEFDKTHTKPELYKSARELNNDRMNKYIDNIGKTGLLHSLSYTIANKTSINEETLAAELAKATNEYSENRAIAEKNGALSEFEKHFGKEPPKEETIRTKIMEERVRNVKLAIGGSAAVLSGGALGGVVGGAAYVAGGMALGAVSGGGKYLSDEAGERKARSEMSKEQKAENDRMRRIEETKERQSKIEEQKAKEMRELNSQLAKLLQKFGTPGSSGERKFNSDDMMKQKMDFEEKIRETQEKIKNLGNSTRRISETIKQADEEIKQTKTRRGDLERERTENRLKPVQDMGRINELNTSIEELNKKEKELLGKKDDLNMQLHNTPTEKTNLTNELIQAFKEKAELEMAFSIEGKIKNTEESYDSKIERAKQAYSTAEMQNFTAKNAAPHSPPPPSSPASPAPSSEKHG
ncbi:MAG: hypothetical protein WCO07_02855 [bacterium]